MMRIPKWRSLNLAGDGPKVIVRDVLSEGGQPYLHLFIAETSR